MSWSDAYAKTKLLTSPGLKPGTSRVLGERDNHYTSDDALLSPVKSVYINRMLHDRDKTRFLGQDDVMTSLRRYVYVINFFHIKMCACTGSNLPDILRAIGGETSR